MKKVMLTICLMLVVITCASCVSIYWYQPGKTLEDCLQDSKQCFDFADEHMGARHSFLPQFTDATHRELYRECMRSSGYQLFDKKKLSMEIRTHENNLFDITYYPLAGE